MAQRLWHFASDHYVAGSIPGRGSRISTGAECKKRDRVPRTRRTTRECTNLIHLSVYERENPDLNLPFLY